MSNSPIAVAGCQLTFTLGVGVVTIITQPSVTVLADSKGVYAGPMSVTITGYVGGSIVINGQASGIIQPTAVCVKADSQYVMRQGDNLSLVITGSDASGHTTTQIDTVTISNAGQTTCLAS